MDLIDRDELLKRFELTSQANGNAIRYEIKCAPTVDAEPVVYCKDCAMSDVCLIESVLIRCGSAKPFCSIGEPKDGDKLCKQ